MNKKKSCSSCTYGVHICVNRDILCRKKGAVSPDYLCHKYKPSPDVLALKNVKFKCIDCENFILGIEASDNQLSVGLCQLFSVRQFDGRTKNACSKFTKRSRREVS